MFFLYQLWTNKDNNISIQHILAALYIYSLSHVCKSFVIIFCLITNRNFNTIRKPTENGLNILRFRNPSHRLSLVNNCNNLPCSIHAATCAGVSPSSLEIVSSAPTNISVSTILLWPCSQALCRGVSPLLFCTLILWPIP